MKNPDGYTERFLEQKTDEVLDLRYAIWQKAQQLQQLVWEIQELVRHDTQNRPSLTTPLLPGNTSSPAGTADTL